MGRSEGKVWAGKSLSLVLLQKPGCNLNVVFGCLSEENHWDKKGVSW